MKRFEERRKRIEDRDPQFSILNPQLLRPAPPALDLSGASEADRYLSAFDNDRDLAPVVGIFQHALEACFVFQDIDVVEGDLTPGVFRTGPRGIGSEILTEDEDFFCWHRYLLSLSQQISNCKRLLPYVTFFTRLCHKSRSWFDKLTTNGCKVCTIN